jgi:hypothetical protein
VRDWTVERLAKVLVFLALLGIASFIRIAISFSALILWRSDSPIGGIPTTDIRTKPASLTNF